MTQPADIRDNGDIPEVVIVKTHSSFFKNYIYLVIDPGTRMAVIVDPAWEMEKIERAVSEAKATVSGILITHSHPDHIHLAKPIAEKYGCPIWMSEEEVVASGFSARQLVKIDKKPWAVGRMLIEPIFTPGHSPGCVSYLIGDNLFAGDVLFAEGCGMCPDRTAAYAMFASLKELTSRLKPQTRIYPGHSYGKPVGQVLSEIVKENIYLQFHDKESFAAFRMRSGQNLSKLLNFS